MAFVERTATATLVSDLWAQIRELADRREIDLDLRLLGKPADIAPAARQVLSKTVGSVIKSASMAEEMHHLALVLSYHAEQLSVLIEHDGTLDTRARSETEMDIFSCYGDIGELGGTLSLSAGRGFGMRLELTLPYSSSGQGSFPADTFLPRAQSRSVLPLQADLPMIVERLTTQEETCLSLLAAGLSNKEIAARMHLGIGTVKFHLAQIYQKLGVQGRGRGAAVARARELGLLFD